MKKSTVKFTKSEVGKFRRVADFLPPPEALVRRDDTVKVTLALSRSSLEFFKEQAAAQHLPYQKMIRALVDHYAEQYQ